MCSQTPELLVPPLASLLRPLGQRTTSTADGPPSCSSRTGLTFFKMPEADTVSESTSRASRASSASMRSAQSVISTASEAAGEVMKFTTKSIVWFLLYALVILGYLFLPGSSTQECAFLTQIGCGKATAWVALRLVVDASVILGTYFGIQSAVSPVVIYKEATTTTTTREPPYNYDRVRRGTLEEIEAAVHKATNLQVTQLFDGVNSTVKITTETPNVVNSTEKVTAVTSLPSTYNLILDLNVTSKSTMAGEDPASTEHPLTKALPSDLDLEDLHRKALVRVSIGLGSWAVTMVVILAITCARHRRTREQMRRRIRRLRSGLRSLARTEMRPYAVDLEQPIQSLARIQASLAAGYIEHNSRVEEETTPPPSPPSSPTPPPPPSPEGIPMVKFTTPLDPKVVSKVLSNNQRVDDLEAMDHWANESLDEVNGFANQSFDHIYGNCEAIYDLPPPIPPRPAGIIKKTIDRVYSFSRARPTATVRPNMASDRA